MKKILLRWFPAFALMTIIFLFSNTPESNLPNFGLFDVIVKKGSHIVVYGLLAVAYWFGLQFDRRRWWIALLYVILYAMTDEFHQSFIPGRHPSWVDVLAFDGGGATLGVILASRMWVKRKLKTKSE
jgi:VanZ family protein